MNSPDRKNRTSVKSPAFKRAGPWVAVCLVAATFGWIWVTPVTIVRYPHNGEWLASGYRLKEDTFDNPRLRLLRSREKLADVMAPGHSQFEKISLLRKWAHDQWSFNNLPFYYPPWDAVEILDLEREIGNKGFCAQYSIVFLQACQAMGIHARYIDLPGHFVVGVWSDEFNRWVVMDPLNDCYYEEAGLPLTGRRLCEAYWKGEVGGIFRVNSNGMRVPMSREDLKVFRMYSIVTEADQLTRPVDVVINNGPVRRLAHETDFRRYPIVGRDRLSFTPTFLSWRGAPAKEFFPGKVQSQDSDDFAYRMNQTLIFVARQDKDLGVVKLILWAENEPSFKEFQFEDIDGSWKVCEREIVWPLEPGINRFRVRTRTTFGWLTYPSECDVFYKPAWWGIRPLQPAASRVPSYGP